MTLGPQVAQSLRWSSSRLPTLIDAEPLRPVFLATRLDADLLLPDCSHITSLELSDGNWTECVADLGPPPQQSVQLERAAAFRRQVGPSMEGAPTR